MEPRNNKKVILLFDFDGTLTNKPGGDVVFSDYYRALQSNPNVDYSYTSLKPADDMYPIMQNEFDQYAAKNNNQRDPKRVSLEALDFLKEVLAMPEVEIAIITRNKMHYIQAMLKFEGIDKSIANNLRIYEMVPKNSAAADFLKDYNPKAVFGFDDNKGDAKKIEEGAKLAVKDRADQVDVRVFQKDPGSFEWDKYLKMIKQKLQPNSSPLLFPAKQQNTNAVNEIEEGKSYNTNLGPN